MYINDYINIYNAKLTVKINMELYAVYHIRNFKSVVLTVKG